MPRLARLDAPGLLQHVMARGIERRKIFKDDKDRKSFLDRLATILEGTQTQCYAWSLIPNHFHLLLRTGPTPLSKVMRRLMTGYAVTFNKRHKRSGHLFQNRYKSVVCEEDPYLLELIRYIHLNPLRAGVIKDLKELDRYPWTGHSTILGRRKNPLVPEVRNLKSGVSNQRTPKQAGQANRRIEPNMDHRSGPSADKRIAFSQFRPETEKAKNNPKDPVNPVGSNKSLAEKTIEDVLLHFGNNRGEARRSYRQFVENGIDQGRRPELQGGGLIRSAGGKKSDLLGRNKEEREKGDERILGSGDFVSAILQDANELGQRSTNKLSLKELLQKVSANMEMDLKELMSASRRTDVSMARAIVAYLAVREMKYPGTEIGRILNISGPGVTKCVERGKKILDNNNELRYKLIN